jgi:hypothetical protein
VMLRVRSTGAPTSSRSSRGSVRLLSKRGHGLLIHQRRTPSEGSGIIVSHAGGGGGRGSLSPGRDERHGYPRAGRGGGARPGTAVSQGRANPKRGGSPSSHPPPCHLATIDSVLRCGYSWAKPGSGCGSREIVIMFIAWAESAAR